jgi:hypothetical protein
MNIKDLEMGRLSSPSAYHPFSRHFFTEKKVLFSKIKAKDFLEGHDVLTVA